MGGTLPDNLPVMTENVDGRRRRYEHRREEVLDAAAEHVLEHGLADLSLRKVADTVGVSHATLVHHFTTKDRLVAEIVDLVLTRAFSSPALVPPGSAEPLRVLWRRATAPAGRRNIRLFIAITGHAMHGSPDLAAAVARSLQQRAGLLAAALAAQGCPREEAAALATLVLGTMRGLLVDLLVTGDEERVEAAFEDLLRDLERRRATWPT